MVDMAIRIRKHSIHHMANRHFTRCNPPWLLMLMLLEDQRVELATDHLLLQGDETLVNIIRHVQTIGTTHFDKPLETYENNHLQLHFALLLLDVVYAVNHPASACVEALSLLPNQIDLSHDNSNELLMSQHHL